MSYIKNNFLLNNSFAEKLYFDYAKDMPIFDYHCHLSEKEILENKQFTSISDLWLGADHYKWRLMRNYGISEEFITGSANPREKFKAYCKALSLAFGNPLYHWSQLELKEFFDCELLINEENADAIFDYCNDYIIKNELNPQKVIEKSNVKYIFTTNDLFDDLTIFNKIKDMNFKFNVAPAFRADSILKINSPRFDDALFKMGEIRSLNDFESFIENKLLAFKEVGCVAADIAVQTIYPVVSREDATKVFEKKLANEKISNEEANQFEGYMVYFLMKLYAKHNVRTELHVGATRNNNSSMFDKLGPDSGFDAMSDENFTNNLSKLFNVLNNKKSLPATILFNLNPKLNIELITLLGCFQDNHNMQYGAAWWFLDNKIYIEKHLKDLASGGHIAKFIGMLTDSRSFLSYTRHQYFRRILCSYFGEMMEKGEITDDLNVVGGVVKDICFNNAENYFLRSK